MQNTKTIGIAVVIEVQEHQKTNAKNRNAHLMHLHNEKGIKTVIKRNNWKQFLLSSKKHQKFTNMLLQSAFLLLSKK